MVLKDEGNFAAAVISIVQRAEFKPLDSAVLCTEQMEALSG